MNGSLTQKAHGCTSSTTFIGDEWGSDIRRVDAPIRVTFGSRFFPGSLCTFNQQKQWTILSDLYRYTDMETFEKGDRVLWKYKHFLNSRQFTMIHKTGVFIRKVKPIKKYLADWNISREAVVKFDGNKTASTVDISQLEKVTPEKSI